MWFLALIAGTMLPLQALINARLGRVAGGPIWAATISFALGTVALLIWVAVQRIGPPTLSTAAQGPVWIWVGGALGAFYVASVIIAVPHLGAASLVALVVCGQTVASMALDHFGVLGPVHGLSPTRALGALLVVGGVWLVVRN